MFDTSVFPTWLESSLIDDDTFGEAYDLVPDNKRAWLKTTIARLHALHGTPQVNWGRQEQHWRQGHVSISESRPVDFSLVVVESNYASGVRLLAATMLPLLSGVENILVTFVGDDVVCPECLAALELAGIETAVVLTVEQCTTLLDDMQSNELAGRILFLGANVRSLHDPSAVKSHMVQTWFEPNFTALGIQKDVQVDRELLVWAHPDWNIIEIAVEEVSSEQKLAAVCCESDIVDSVPDFIPVSLGAGQEGCWIWPDLQTQWFTHCRFSLLSEV